MDERIRYFVDLFAGAGGLSLGLTQAGFVPALVNEVNEDAMETYLINHDEDHPLLRERYSFGDVRQMSNSGVFATLEEGFARDYGISLARGELDLLVGGPPCQGYSGIGHRRSYHVSKAELPSNHLYLEMTALIGKFQPKLFLFENVKGILTGKWTENGENGEIWRDVQGAFSAIPGYSVRWSLVHAKDYGVPQNRPRVLLVGVREDVAQTQDGHGTALEAGLLPSPTAEYPNLDELLGDLVDGGFQYGAECREYINEPQNAVQLRLRTNRSGLLMGRGTALTEQYYNKHTPRVVEKFTHMLNNNGLIPETYKTKKFAQKLLPPQWDERGPTITACCLADDYVHYCQPRVLTVREWARLQTFPDWYRFAGKRTTGGLRRAGNPREGIHERELPKYTQIGNAVPVEMARRIGEHFIRFLEENDA